MKYKLNEQVYWAHFESEETFVQCPHCAGTRHHHVIMGDGTEVDIDCDNCKIGYDEFSRGTVKAYIRTPKATLTTIIGIEITTSGVKYRIEQSYQVDEDRLSYNEVDALTIAQAMVMDFNQREADNISSKHKDHRSWSWHVTYYRKQIKDAERQIDYATRKLNVAKERAKK